MRCVLCSRDFSNLALIFSITLFSVVANIRSAALCSPEFRCMNIFKTPADLTSNDLWLLLRHLSKPMTNELRQSVLCWVLMFFTFRHVLQPSFLLRTINHGYVFVFSISWDCVQHCGMSTALPLDVTLSVFHFLQVHPSGPPKLGERRTPSKNGRGMPFLRVPPQFDHCSWTLSSIFYVLLAVEI